MSSIDNRVVEMQFDDADFEPGILSAIKALDKLNESLKINGGNAKGFDIVSSTAMSAAKSADGLNYSVSRTITSLNVLELVAASALNTIVSKATAAGMSLVRSLTIDQLSAGFAEYELKMGSIQTIMASTGKPLSEVNRLLDELNTYADRTIYSFSDMTANIGKFTNAGVDLDLAVKAIQGISNEAAVSGANAAEASRAMYNFAQALSAGYVKLIDWKSIENANMATVEFKQELINTAVELGTVRKEGDKYISTTKDLNGHVSDAFTATSMFNDSLSSQWMTTDVLTTTLARYSDETTDIGKKAFAAAQDIKTFSQMMDTIKESIGSGWGTTFTLIFGDFEEAKQMWTGLNNAIESIISPIEEYRNGMLRVWREMGGREAIINGISNSFEALKRILAPVAETFNNAFHPERFGKWLGEISNNFEKFSETLSSLNLFDPDFWKEGPVEALVGAISQVTDDADLDSVEESAEAVSTIFSTLFESVSEAGKSVEEVHEPFYRLRNILDGVWYSIKFIVQIFHQFKTVATDIIRKVLDVIWPYVDRAVDFLSFIGECIKNLYDYFFIADELTSMVGDAENEGKNLLGFNLSTGYAKDFADAAASVGGLLGALKKLKSVLGGALMSALEKLLGNVDGIVGKFKDWVKETDPIGTALKFVKESAEKATEWVEKFTDKIKEVGIFQVFAEAVDKVRDAFIRLQEQDTIFGALARGLQTVIDWGSKFIEKAKEIYEAVKTNIIDALTDTGIIDSVLKIVDGFKNLDADEFSEGIRGFANGIKQLITDYIGPALTEAFETMKTNVTTFLESDMPEQLAASISEALQFDNFRESVDGLIKGLQESNVATEVAEWAGGIWQSITDSLATNPVFTLLGGGFSTVSDFLSRAIKTLGGPIGTAIGTLGDGIGKSLDTMFEELYADPDAALETGLQTLMGLEVFRGINSIITLFDTISTDLKGVKDITAGIKNFFTGLGKMFTGIGVAGIGAAVLEVAGAVLLIAFAIEKIASIDPDKLVIATGIVMGILTAVAFIFRMMAAIANDGEKASEDASTVADSLGKGLSFFADKITSGLSGLNLAAVAISVIAIAASVFIIVMAIEQMARLLETFEPSTLVISAAILLGFIAALAAIIGIVTRGIKPQAVLAAGAAIFLIALSLGMFIDAIKRLAEMQQDSAAFDQGLMALVVLLGVIAGFTWLMTQAAGTATTLVGIAAGVLIISIALNNLLAAVLALGMMDPNTLLQGLGAVSLLLIVMGAVMGGLAESVGSVNPLSILAIGVSLVLMSAAVGILAAAIGILASVVDPTRLIVSALVISMLLAALAGLMVLLSDMASTNMGSFIAAALSIIVFSVAINIMADAIQKLADIPLETLATCLAPVGEALLALTLIGALAGAAPPVAVGMLAVAAAMEMLGEAVDKMGDGFIKFVEGLERISNFKEDTFSGAADGFKDLINTIAESDFIGAGAAMWALSDISDTFFDLAGSLERFNQHASEAASDLRTFKRSIDEFDIPPDKIQMIIDFFNALGDAAPSMKSFKDNADKAIEFFQKVGAVLPGFADAASTFSSCGDSFCDALDHLGDTLAEFSETAVDSPKALQIVASAATRLAHAFADGLGNAAANLGDSGRSLVTSFANGITTNVTVVLTAVSFMMKGVTNAISNKANAFYNAGATAVSKFKSGLSSASGLASAGAAMVQAAKNGAINAVSGWAFIGQMMAQGLIKGLTSMHSQLYQAAYQASRKAAQGASDGAQVQSPSRVMYGIGRYMAMGLALGISENSDLAYNTAKNVAERTVASVEKALNNPANNARFTITPIVNDKNLGTFTASIRDNGNLVNESIRSVVSQINQNGTSTADLLMEMQQFRKDLAEFSRPVWSVTMGNVDMTNDAAVADATRDYISRLARLRGGM